MSDFAETNKVECPHCKGQKGWDELRSREWEKPKNEWVACWTCRGKGKVSKMEAAIYKARGGPAPVPLKGYA